MRLNFFRLKQRTEQQHQQQQQQKPFSSHLQRFNSIKKKRYLLQHDEQHYQQPQPYFHQIKANGALVFHRKEHQRRSSMDEILDGHFPILDTPQSLNKYKKTSTWSPAAMTPTLKRRGRIINNEILNDDMQQQQAEEEVEVDDDGNKDDEGKNCNNTNSIQHRRQELLEYYLSQHQQRSSKLLKTQEKNYQDTNTMVLREERLEREVQHLKRMVTLLRNIVLSSSTSSTLSTSSQSTLDSYHHNTNTVTTTMGEEEDDFCQNNSSNNDDSESEVIAHSTQRSDGENRQHHYHVHSRQASDLDTVVTYERKLQILFQEISGLHKEQENSAMRYRELQQRHDELCTKLREKDEMVSCLQSDLRALMIND